MEYYSTTAIKYRYSKLPLQPSYRKLSPSSESQASTSPFQIPFPIEPEYVPWKKTLVPFFVNCESIFFSSQGSPRFRRHADPQGSLVIDAKKPLSGPDRRPSLDVDYHQRVYDRNGVNADAYGGLNVRPGQPAQPHLGVQIGREYKNGFIRGYSQAERGPGGRISPSFGIGGGFRFRRNVDDMMSEELGY